MKKAKIILLSLAAVTGLYLILSVINIMQNGPFEADGRRPEVILGRDLEGATAADLKSLSKTEIMQLFLALPVPAAAEMSGEFGATLLEKGVLSGVTALYTHYIFGPGRWVGKGFGPATDGRGAGYNLFAPRGGGTGARITARPMRFYVGSSPLDGRMSYILDYSSFGEITTYGMQDEIRKINDRLFLCMGYMSLGGGSINPAPFLLIGPGRPISSAGNNPAAR